MPQSKAERRAAGRKRVELWLPEATVERLDEICAESGYTRGEQVESMIDEYEEWKKVASLSQRKHDDAQTNRTARARKS
jgi:hypothetical protein